MQLPSLIPSSLGYCAAFSDEEELWNSLSENTSDLILFFEAAADDETWSGKHAAFMRRVVEELGEDFFRDRLSFVYANRLARAIQAHYSVFSPLLPLNIEVQVAGSSIPMNSLLLGASCPFLHDLIRRECFEKEKKQLPIEGVRKGIFALMQQFVEKGDLPTLWRHPKEEIEELLRLAQNWGQETLFSLCQETLKRYIDGENCYEILALSIEGAFPQLKQHAIAELNKVQGGVRLSSEKEGELCVEFRDFYDRTLKSYERILRFVTHLSFSAELHEDERVQVVVRSTPHLIGVDLSDSPTFSPLFLEFPSTLEEINLSLCSWLDAEYFCLLVEKYPGLRRLYLVSNTHLDPLFWGELHLLERLEVLDISRCHQVETDPFTLLSRSSPHLKELSIADCRKVNEAIFIDFLHAHPHLTHLCLARCSFSDAVFAELALHCRELIELDATRCTELSAKGVWRILEGIPTLQRLTVTRIGLLEEQLISMRATYPFIEITD